MEQDLNESVKKAEEEHGTGSDFFKFQEGPNVMRIITKFHRFAEHYHPSDKTLSGVCLGKDEICKACNREDKDPKPPTPKWMAWMANSEGLRIVKFGTTIMKQLGALQKDSDWSFSDFPMPYPININAEGAGTKEVTYTVIAKPKSESPPELLEALEKKRMPNQIVDSMIEKKEKERDGVVEHPRGVDAIDYPDAEDEGISPDDIPF